jgi:uncharacterized protein YndB with AHSA1/START domain
MNVELAGASITGDIVIEAPPQVVYDALVSPAELEQWWGQDGVYRTHDWKIDLRPGGERSCRATGPSGGVMIVSGVHLEIDPPRTLVHTWKPSWEPTLPETTIRYTLTAVPEGTLLRIEHTGFDADHVKSQQGHREGWMRVLGWLARYAQERKVAQ